MNKPLNKSTHTVWHRATVTRQRREQKNTHKSVVLWFTGFSGSGKSTLAHAVEERLHQSGLNTFVLDGDNIRHGLCSDLGFSDQDRKENIRRISETAKLLIEAGVITLTAFISPFKAERATARSLMPQGDFIEIYCFCPLTVCEQRDVKGLYKKARLGEILDFTGISSPYEEPENPDLKIDTHQLTLEESVQQVISLLRDRNILPAPAIVHTLMQSTV
ncbi:MAG: adenylyl-sulfate kinase [Methylobacter sp.]|uniref:adenylyl-sulfate kinase n=1 Tax=Methylobacter sp. TaxID=2051955 RepID=UPI0027316A66|nr:adenylyl-sulfate kinase [Methylobacter sp.]MDP1665944.1 adenylyl-sulfate kinase [Methylobacter sp.]